MANFLAKVSECYLAEIVKMFCVFEYRLENVFSDRRFLEFTKKIPEIDFDLK